MKFSAIVFLLLCLLVLVLLVNFWVSPSADFPNLEDLSVSSHLPQVHRISRLKNVKARPPTPPTPFYISAMKKTNLAAAHLFDFSQRTSTTTTTTAEITSLVAAAAAVPPISSSLLNPALVQRFIPRARNLIFTSAGDRSGLAQKQWLKGLKQGEDVDLVVYYYGKQEEVFRKFTEIAMYVHRANGTKFDNFYEFFWANSLLQETQYEYVAIFDDDITWQSETYLSAPFFGKLFEVCHAQQPWVAGPAWDSRAKNQSTTLWTQTHLIESAEYHYVNFVEMNTIVLRMDKLREIMKKWPYKELLALGSDLWLIQTLGKDHKDRFLIVDSTPYVNLKRQGSREIDTWQNYTSRKKAWQAYARSHHLALSLPRLTYYIHYKGVRDPAVLLAGRAPPRFKAISGVPGLLHSDRRLLARYFSQADSAMFWSLGEAAGLAAYNGVKRALVFDDISTANILKLPPEFTRVRRAPSNSSSSVYFSFLNQHEAFDIYYLEGKRALSAVAASFLHASKAGMMN